MSEPLKCYVRKVRRYQRGAPPRDWLWFFTLPLVYSVWLRKDGATPADEEAFLHEQAALAGAHRREGHDVAPSP